MNMISGRPLPALGEAPYTLADGRHYVMTCEGISAPLRRNHLSELSGIERICGMPTAGVELTCPNLCELLYCKPAAAFGLTPQRFGKLIDPQRTGSAKMVICGSESKMAAGYAVTIASDPRGARCCPRIAGTPAHGPRRNPPVEGSKPLPDAEAPSEPARPLLTLADLEERTGLSGSKLRRDIRSKKLVCLRFGRAIRITEEAYEAYLRRHR